MKILFVNNFRGRGGGEEFLRDLLPGLVAKGVNVGLVCRPGTPLAGMFQAGGINVLPISRSGIDGLTSLFKTARVIREGAYDVIAIQRGHDIVQSWMGTVLSGKRPALMYIAQVPEFIRSQFLLNRMNKIVTISRYIRDKILTFSPAAASKTSIIYYGIDHEKFRPSTDAGLHCRNRLGLKQSDKIIGTVGDLWKNQIEFLDALVLIKKEISGVRFVLAGSSADTTFVQDFKKRAEELGLSDTLVWAGRLSKEEMKEFYAALDVAVSTHRNEGFGIWVLEALASGAPVISVKEGGIRDSLEGCDAGMLVKDGASEMAEAVVSILKNDAQRKRMSDAGRQWVAQKFTRERMVDEYFRFFESMNRTV